MKAITMKEPWASMIAHGFKKMETRSWATSYRGKIAIHAGKGKPDKAWMDNVPEMMEMVGDIHPGCVIAIADLVDCIPITDNLIEEVKRSRCEYISGFYSAGRFAWVLENVKQIDPVKAKGKLGLWNWEDNK